MSGELSLETVSGLTIYALIRGTDRRLIWTGSEFVSETTIPDTSTWQTYLRLLTESELEDGTHTGSYIADWPVEITTNGVYTIEYYNGLATPTDVAIATQAVTINAGSITIESDEDVIQSQCYGTVSRGSVYLLAHKFDYQPVWGDSDKQQIAINQATQLIDTLNYSGEKADPDQVLEFPRNEDTTIPAAIEKACYEIAFALLGGKDIDFEATTKADVSTQTILGRHQIDPSYLTEARRHNIPSEIAWNLLRPFLRDVSSPFIERLYR